MSHDLIISVSGLRGIVGETFTPEVAYRYAAAFAATLPAGPVLVTRDGRANGPPLVEPIIAGLAQEGSRRVFVAGIAATPTTGVLVRQHDCVGGIQISASHNPAPYNGMKLFSAEGRVVPATAGAAVLDLFQKSCPPDRPIHAECESPNAAATIAARRPAGLRAGRTAAIELEDTVSAHLALIERCVEVERIRRCRFRVLLDSNHGAGSLLGKPLLERLGCEVVAVGEMPDGHFQHEPEPTAENLASVVECVTARGAQVGFCQDPDADRLAIIDERGRYVGEEYTLALCVDHVLRHTPGPVVANCSTSRMTEDLALKYNVPFHRSAVGEANVVDEMLRCGAVLGGEGNGGVIDPRVVLVRDSFVGMALVLAAMAERAMTIGDLVDELPRYAIHKAKVTVDRNSIPAALDALEHHFAAASSDRLDGLRLDWHNPDESGRWLLVRASNTEPIVRIIAEAPTEATARHACDEAAGVIAAKVP
ncbi:MAG: phosphoglucosamine mutase [Pirellulales bacterium]|nr:phosphoglucosamine mutase [Pirellulales bacterium]